LTPLRTWPSLATPMAGTVCPRRSITGWRSRVVNPILAAVNDYRRLGVAPIPLFAPDGNGGCSCPLGDACESPAKHPRVKWRQYQEAGPSTEELRSWRRLFETGNVGVLCGPPSGGLVGLDFDNRLALENFLDVDPDLLKTTPIVDTARGGHVYLRTPRPPQGFTVAEIGLDVKASGGLLVAPPSVHASGTIYAFRGEPVAILQVPDLARWLKERLDLLGVAWEPGRSDGGNGHKPRLDVADALAALHEGNRSDTFARIAGRLHRGLWAPGEIVALLAPHAERVGFDVAELEREVEGICNRYEQRQPPAAAEQEVLRKVLA